jgi:hypothetical protein
MTRRKVKPMKIICEYCKEELETTGSLICYVERTWRQKHSL